MIHVAADGSGDFVSVQKALDSLSPDDNTEKILYIHQGVYREQITVRVPFVTILGGGPGQTILTHGFGAREILEDGKKRGTFRTYSCLIDTHDFHAKNITFENTAGPGPEAGQALAVYADGDRLFFEDCRFLGNQDTLFTGPLPPKEIEPDGFLGPKQHAPRVNGRHYYKNCYIEGDVDFIFGSATAFFESCTLFSKYTGKEINSFVTAASTPKGQEYGYVMESCRFESNCPPNSACLGRPWRQYAKAVLINCYMDSHICPQGWNDWGKQDSHKTCFYAEYKSFGPGGCIKKRPEWIHRLKEEEVCNYTRQKVLGGTDSWDP